MRSKPSPSRSSKTTRTRNYRTHSVNHTSGYHTCQKPRSPDKAQLVILTLALIIHIFVYAVLVVAFFITQNYAMLSIVTVMAHQIGYALQRMIESMFMKKRGKKKWHKKKAEVTKKGAFLPLP